MKSGNLPRFLRKVFCWLRIESTTPQDAGLQEPRCSRSSSRICSSTLVSSAREDCGDGAAGAGADAVTAPAGAPASPVKIPPVSSERLVISASCYPYPATP